MIRSRKICRSTLRAFTLIELVVSIAIFAMMTALVVAKYSTFNSSVLFTNAAYDAALAIRTAQTYGLSVRGNGSNNFSSIYGINFNIGLNDSVNCNTPDDTKFTLFMNPAGVSPSDSYFSCTSSVISSYTLRQGVRISSICAGNQATDCDQASAARNDLVITFKRPDPDALVLTHLAGSCWIAYPGAPDGYHCVPTTTTTIQDYGVNFIRIILASADAGETRTIDVYKNGQISVH